MSLEQIFFTVVGMIVFLMGVALFAIWISPLDTTLLRGKWEVVEVKVGDTVLGYHVRWSVPTDGQYLVAQSFSLHEYEKAERYAQNLNVDCVCPWEFDWNIRDVV